MRPTPLRAAAHRSLAATSATRCCAPLGAASLDALMDEAIPPAISLAQPLVLPPAESESIYLTRLATIART